MRTEYKTHYPWPKGCRMDARNISSVESEVDCVYCLGYRLSPDPDGLLSTAQFATAAGLSVNQATYWERKKMFVPEVKPRGSGTRSKWSPKDVDAARVLGVVSSDFGGVIDINVLRQIKAAHQEGRSSVKVGSTTISWDRLDESRPGEEPVDINPPTTNSGEMS